MYVETTQEILWPKNIYGKLMHFIENPEGHAAVCTYIYLLAYHLYVNIWNGYALVPSNKCHK